MSKWNIKFRERKKIIEIKKIFQRYPAKNDISDFPAPAMDILDQDGKRHLISYLDSISFKEEWNKIEVGTKIELNLREFVVKAKILPVKPLKTKGTILAKFFNSIPPTDCIWFCFSHNTGGTVDVDPVSGSISQKSLEENLEKHLKYFPECNLANNVLVAQMIDGKMEKDEELIKIVAAKLKKVVLK